MFRSLVFLHFLFISFDSFSIELEFEQYKVSEIEVSRSPNGFAYLNELKGKYKGKFIFPISPSASKEMVNCDFNENFQFYHCDNGGYFFISKFKIYPKEPSLNSMAKNYSLLDLTRYEDIVNEEDYVVSKMYKEDNGYIYSRLKNSLKKKRIKISDVSCIVYSEGLLIFFSDEFGDCTQEDAYGHKMSRFRTIKNQSKLRISSRLPFEFFPSGISYFYRHEKIFANFLEMQGYKGNTRKFVKELKNDRDNYLIRMSERGSKKNKWK